MDKVKVGDRRFDDMQEAFEYAAEIGEAPVNLITTHTEDIPPAKASLEPRGKGIEIKGNLMRRSG